MAYKVQVWEDNVLSSYNIGDVNTKLSEREFNREQMYPYIKSIAEDERCTYAVSIEYVNNVIEENHLYLILMRETGEDIGFILARYLADGGVYLDVICAYEGGSQFLKFFIALCEVNGASYIELSSLLNVLAFYPTLGFEHRKDCTPGKGADIAMSDELREYIKSQMKAGVLTKYDSYYKDPYVLNYLMELHKLKYTNMSADEYPESCKNPAKITGAQFAQRHCGRDGFTMRKCLSIPPAPTLLSVAKSAYMRPEGKSKKAKKRGLATAATRRAASTRQYNLSNYPIKVTGTIPASRLTREAKQLLKNMNASLPTKRTMRGIRMKNM